VQLRPVKSKAKHELLSIIASTTALSPLWHGAGLRKLKWIDTAKHGKQQHAFQYPCYDRTHAEHIVYALYTSHAVHYATYAESSFDTPPELALFTPDGELRPHTHHCI